MKVLYIFSTSIVSGAEYVSIDLIKTDRQNEYFVLTSDIPELCKLLEDIIPVSHIYKSKWLRLQNVSSSRGILKLFRLMKKAISVFIVRNKISSLEKKIKPDLIIGHNTHDAIFLYKSSTKKILQVYDNIAKNSNLAFMIKNSTKKIDRYIVDASSIKKDLIEIGLKPEIIDIVYNGVETKVNNKRNINQDLIFILWIGSFEERKNPIEFFEIIELLKEKKWEIGVNFVFRKTDLDYYEKNKSFLERRQDLNFKIYEKSDILFCTSKQDPLPTVILEAFSFGIPVIGRNIKGINEMIISEKNGYLYESIDNIDEIFKKIINDYSNYSLGAINTIKENFSTEIKYRKIKEIYSLILRR